jgi:L-serine dehydratase
MISPVLDGHPKVVSNAAESALDHHLGMTCDPVAGYVQIRASSAPPTGP